MRLIYVALAASAIAALTFMLLWAQSESEKAQLLNKYEVIRNIARQEQALGQKITSAEPASHTGSEFSENTESPAEPNSGLTASPLSKPSQAESVPKLPDLLQRPPLPTNLRPENIQKLQGIQQRLLGLMASGKAADIDEISKLLTELQAMQKTGVNFQGMDFSIAQNNLELVKQIQVLSDEIQLLSKHSPVDSNKLNAAIAKLNKLQTQIKSPISAIPNPPN